MMPLYRDFPASQAVHGMLVLVVDGRRDREVWLRQRTDCHSTDGLVALMPVRVDGADPDANSSAGLHSAHRELDVMGAKLKEIRRAIEE
jgi:hypothetical protein